MVKNLQIRKIVVPLQRKTEKDRAFSSAGSERLPYKQRVGGSNPSTPTQEKEKISRSLLLFCFPAFAYRGSCAQAMEYRRQEGAVQRLWRIQSVRIRVLVTTQ